MYCHQHGGQNGDGCDACDVTSVMPVISVLSVPGAVTGAVFPLEGEPGTAVSELRRRSPPVYIAINPRQAAPYILITAAED